jgi:hypothetical protein
MPKQQPQNRRDHCSLVRDLLLAAPGCFGGRDALQHQHHRTTQDLQDFTIDPDELSTHAMTNCQLQATCNQKATPLKHPGLLKTPG